MFHIPFWKYLIDVLQEFCEKRYILTFHVLNMLLIAVKILMNNHLTWRLNPYFSIFEQEEKRLKIVSLFKFLHNRSITNPSKIEKEILSACSNYKTSWHLLLIISWTVTSCNDFVWIAPWLLHMKWFCAQRRKIWSINYSRRNEKRIKLSED